jgi:hypothetical protein
MFFTFPLEVKLFQLSFGECRKLRKLVIFAAIKKVPRFAQGPVNRAPIRTLNGLASASASRGDAILADAAL